MSSRFRSMRSKIIQNQTGLLLYTEICSNLMQEVVGGIVRCYMCQVDQLSHHSAFVATSLASDTRAADSIFDALAQACSSGRAIKEVEMMLESGQALQLILSCTRRTCNNPCSRSHSSHALQLKVLVPGIAANCVSTKPLLQSVTRDMQALMRLRCSGESCRAGLKNILLTLYCYHVL